MSERSAASAELTPMRGPALAPRARLLVVTGMSGAGRSTALKVLEDMGYEAVDNLPLSLLPDLLRNPGQRPPLAIGVDVRTRDFAVPTLIGAVDRLVTEHRIELRIVFLDCEDDRLVRRYTETRRRHPLGRRPAGDGRHRLGAPAPCPLARPRRSRYRYHRLEPGGSQEAAPWTFRARCHTRHHHLRNLLLLPPWPAARRGSGARRAVLAQSPLRGGAAAAYRPRRGGGHLHRRRSGFSAFLRAALRLASALAHRATRARARAISPSRWAAPAAGIARSSSPSAWRQWLSQQGRPVGVGHRDLDPRAAAVEPPDQSERPMKDIA